MNVCTGNKLNAFDFLKFFGMALCHPTRAKYR
jgi:hypothetical protein